MRRAQTGSSKVPTTHDSKERRKKKKEKKINRMYHRRFHEIETQSEFSKEEKKKTMISEKSVFSCVDERQ